MVQRTNHMIHISIRHFWHIFNDGFFLYEIEIKATAFEAIKMNILKHFHWILWSVLKALSACLLTSILIKSIKFLFFWCVFHYRVFDVCQDWNHQKWLSTSLPQRLHIRWNKSLWSFSELAMYVELKRRIGKIKTLRHACGHWSSKWFVFNSNFSVCSMINRFYFFDDWIS